MGYVACDVVYNTIDPQCQPGKFRLSTILFHHFVTMWLVLHPWQHPENGHLTAYSTVVELNTLFITLQRLFKSKFCQMGFYATWLSMRLMWYPYLIRRYHNAIVQWGAAPLTYTWWQVVGSQCVLVGLNFVWTGEVLYGMLRRKRKAG
eukprot:CAMPEP_0170626952 /NCGR_PEP_ID=MMETSP0224-20130122/31657_1 /TAXON_ID=285029 /ORGANISM="Togula jolla, Strain CCCM 725" /LENGTH=147 /DNA_ID=CAMNT_0010953809 /DNA_START=119 /DNA_END=562 /DNA_ORIENTATION=-